MPEDGVLEHPAHLGLAVIVLTVLDYLAALSTREDDMLGLLDGKRYVFELRSGPVERETWKRYERIFEANRASKTRE